MDIIKKKKFGSGLKHSLNINFGSVITIHNTSTVWL